MERNKFHSFAVMVLLLLVGVPVLAEDFCKHVEILSSDFSLDSLNKNEKALICGSDTPGWGRIPFSQAKTNFELALRQRGYFRFEITEKPSGIKVKTGPVTKITKIDFQDPPPNFFDMKFVGVEGNILNSDSLNKIKKWTVSRLRSLGYPCPDVEISGRPEEGVVLVELKTGEVESISQVRRGGENFVDNAAISRFDAFPIKGRYNGDLFILSSRRIMRFGLADYSDFHSFCNSPDRKKNHFEQELTFGAARRIVFSLGGTTEEYPIVKLSWENSRLGRQASSLRSELDLSQVRQTINSELNWFMFPSYPRFFVRPRVDITRASESFYEALSQSLSSGIGLSHDDSVNRYQFEFRPSYNVENTFRGQGPEHTSFFSFDSEIDIVSHLYELYEASPRVGYQLSAKWATRRQGLGSSQNGDRYEISGTFLQNWGGFDPPLVVFGLRFKVQALTASRPQDTPLSLRLFLGGDDDLRGFTRKSLNNGDLGFSSLYYLGSEMRFVRVLPYKLQPFLLADVAQVATQGFDILPTVFWSPGVGLRWQSPVGAMRTTLAYGMTENPTFLPSGDREQWKFFFSFGKEF